MNSFDDLLLQLEEMRNSRGWAILDQEEDFFEDELLMENLSLFS